MYSISIIGSGFSFLTAEHRDQIPVVNPVVVVVNPVVAVVNPAVAVEAAAVVQQSMRSPCLTQTRESPIGAMTVIPQEPTSFPRVVTTLHSTL